MTKLKLCTGSNVLWPHGRAQNDRIVDYVLEDSPDGRGRRVKRGVEKKRKAPRLTCPICGRRLLGKRQANAFCTDEDIRWVLPPHKPKGWWKIGKPRRKLREQ